MPPSPQVKGCRLGPGGQSLPHAGSRVAQAAPGGSPLRGAPARDPARAPRRACSGHAAAAEVPRGRQVASRSIPRPRLRARTATPQAARLRGPESPGTPRRPGLSAAGRRGGEGRPRTLTLVVLQQPVRAHVPHLHRAVRAAGGDARAAGVEVHAGDEAGKTGAARRTGRARRLGADPRTPSTVPQPRTPSLPPPSRPVPSAGGQGRGSGGREQRLQ